MSDTKCPLCGKYSVKPWVNKSQRMYYYCRFCRHIFILIDELILKQTEDYYKDGSIFFEHGNKNYYFDKNYLMSMSSKFDWVKSLYKKDGALLDVGANFGHFLKVAEKEFNTQGIEISPVAVEWSKKNLGVNNAVASIENLPEAYSGPYDIVTMWDVIEHLPDWKPAMENISKVLKTNGLLFLSTPDSSSFTAKILGKRWYYLDPLQHFHIFSKKNLMHILEKNNFEIIDIRYWGRHYSIKYILDRLVYLSTSKTFNKTINYLKRIFGFLENATVYISMRDVIGICARKKG